MPVIIAVPVADGVKVTLQVPDIRVQLPEELKTPAAPIEENATVPEGVRAVPAEEVSVTVAMQEEAVPTATGVPQETEVEVVRRLTRILAATVLELAL